MALSVLRPEMGDGEVSLRERCGVWLWFADVVRRCGSQMWFADAVYGFGCANHV